ncbi:carboxyltransferase domain-containing protein [Citricoccus sp. SGAir0253]|uniref:5-oxoprolinase subunit B/C family protein n=1 Tax=Citricoccus sp. SGAir0253 TaxID=2567881 RepID=UPI0010CD01C7|nr:carboxyltransferase domain-containing protein [Citricoccus sp. SGAir0253]QCU77234.1 carboxyltransferase domain-containing protein [Citricoccus sp. SGAir0253]
MREVRWAGPRAFLVECGSLSEVVALHARLRAEPLPGQVEAVAAAATLALSFTHRSAAVAAAGAVRTLAPVAGEAAEARTVEIDVVYDGEDLAEVGELTGLGADGVVRVHAGTEWTGAFGGFAPGFTYLVAEGDPLSVPRRATPRTAVPAGSVAVAGTFSAVYPRSSPGGWQLLGHTDARLWDLDRPEPALVRPGDRVRYRPVRALATLTDARPGGAPTPAAGATAHPALEVVSAGLQSLVQDLGRPGLGDLGVPAAGAADPSSARQANRLVGNGPDAAVVEALLGGLAVRARGTLVLALAGAEVPAVITAAPGRPVGDALRSGGAAADAPGPGRPAAGPGRSVDRLAHRPATRPAPLRAPFALLDGETLELGEPVAGLRAYLAVRGGIDVPAVLGSRSTDTLSGIGPEPLAPGAVLPVGTPASLAAVGLPEPAPAALPRAGRTTVLRVLPGPRADWFGPAGLEVLTGQDWAVGSQSSRVGVRLEAPAGGAPLARRREGELASEAAVAGALQVPPSGLPVLFLADHPVTGGYPVIGVVVPEDLPLAAQLPPGAAVRFALADPDAPVAADAPTDQHASRED